MKMPFDRTRLITTGSLLLAGTVVIANGTRFSDYTPLPSSAGPVAVINEDTPITFGNPDFEQRSVVDRSTQLAANKPNSGNFDMNTVNETGPHKARYLFTVYETGESGVQRHDLETGTTDTIWQTPTEGGHVAFDACYWTPWGTLITAEESWETEPEGSDSPYGRLFELKNPITAPGILNPVTALSNAGADFVHQNVIPRTSHEGIQFDKAGNMYFIDELNGGGLYKYTSAASLAERQRGAGRLLRCRPDLRATRRRWRHAERDRRIYVGSVYGCIRRCSARGDNDYRRKWGHLGRCSQHHRSAGIQRLPTISVRKTCRFKRCAAASTSTSRRRRTNEVYRLDLGNQTISVFANRTTKNLATGLAVGSALASPDNLAIDHEGNIYIIEDRSGGSDDDIWFAKDLNDDGDLTDPGEGIGRWASNGTRGIRIHGPLLRSDRQAPRLGQHSASQQRQRSHDRNHDSEIALSITQGHFR